MPTQLDALLSPASIAVIGASDNIHKIGGRPIYYMRQHGYAGTIYPVNPQRETIQGIPSFPSLDALPTVPELAIIVVAGDAAVQAVKDCARLGVQSAIVIASGFGEAGEEGKRQQDEMVRIARDASLRIVGPNSQGLANFGNGAVASFSTMFIEVPPQDGPVAVVSQSGGMAAMVYGLLRSQGIGVRHVHATGNQADVTVSELALAVAHDPDVKLLLLYLESLSDPDTLAQAAAVARARGVPVVAVKAGRTGAGQRAAASHTGAMASEDRAVDAFLARHGIWRADDAHALARCAPLYLRGWQPSGRRLVVVSNSGASCVMAADAADTLGLSIAPLSDATQAALAERLPGFAATANPVDVTAALLTNSALFGDVLPVVAEDPSADLFLLDIPVAGMGYDVPRFARDAAHFADNAGKPIAVAAWQESVASVFRAAGVPTFQNAADALAAFQQLTGHQALLRTVAQEPPTVTALPSRAHDGNTRTLSEAASLARLADAGISVVEHALCRTADEAVAAWRGIGAPVAVKASSPQVPHKSEHGLVMLHCNDEQTIRQAFDAQTRTLSGMQAECEGVIVARMTRGQRELMVGAHWDPTFGAVLLVGDGGKYVEVLRDTALLLAPASPAAVGRALASLRIAPLLSGVRGDKPIDMEALCRLAADVGRMVHDARGAIASVDLNPVMAGPDGAVVVDALIEVTGQS
ncbi:acetate--CoA ligase family protein [Cupriavidus plantarum]|uniref:acetate--CoA ligase family protein n=2 Tax=Cupriavidus plantarum TaxID=942865 RepID=UPI001B0A99E6|nr:acetate--CoA ligase family protein [Cupriavidus plantarum]CAG2128273.1 Trans-feruloyl-CoA synthase FCS1 [Cupriavidus plantarum]SMR66546.1 Acyl-CoA synthetase (NDP forming) [Cupriavidus plantarum]